MGDRLYLERFVWFCNEAKKGAYPNATGLAGKFECSVKTAQRSINYFRERLMAPLEYDRSKRGYYLDDPSFELPLMWLSDAELLALLISKKLLTDASAGRLDEDLGRVTEKLGRLITESIPAAIPPERIFSFHWTEFSPAAPEIFNPVTGALINSKLLTFEYYSPANHERTRRTVEPHHLMNYMGNWHLLAWCRLRKAWRDFHLSRMKNCEVESGGFSPRPESEWKSNLVDSFGIFQGENVYHVVLRFSPLRARWVREQRWHPDQVLKELPDDSITLTVPVAHKIEIMMEILKHGSEVEVLEPGWLREEIRREIEKMKEIYEK